MVIYLTICSLNIHFNLVIFLLYLRIIGIQNPKKVKKQLKSFIFKQFPLNIISICLLIDINREQFLNEIG